MRLLAQIVAGERSIAPDQDENLLRQLGYAASLVRGPLNDPEDNLGAAIRLAAEALEGTTATAIEFCDPVQAKWGAPRHLDAEKLRFETPLLIHALRQPKVPIPAGCSLLTDLIKHLSELSRRLGPLVEPVQASLADNFAVHCHTQNRMSYDVHTKWCRKVPIPYDMRVFEIDATGYSGGRYVIVMHSGIADVLESFPPE